MRDTTSETGARWGAARRRRVPAPGLLGRWLARGYGAIMARRNRRFDAGHGVVTLDRPVISVGNLSTGGTGKTPMTMRVAQWLREAGHTPAIAMRGYRAGPEGSDEALLYQEAFAGMPIVAQANRIDGLLQLFAQEEGDGEAGNAPAKARTDVVVLDDGFQHRQIARQFDLVLIDATRDPFADALLPAGWLREPAASLRRAHAVVLTHAESADARRLEAIRERVLAMRPGAIIAEASHAWAGLRVHESGERGSEGGDELDKQSAGATAREEPVAWLRGRRALAVCAIGNPEAFLDGVREATGREVTPIVLRDHDPYAERAVARIIAAAKGGEGVAGHDAIVTTAKDWVKLRRVPIERWPCPVAVVRLEMRFASGGEVLRNAIVSAASVLEGDAADGTTRDDELPSALRLDRLTGEAVGEDAVRE